MRDHGVKASVKKKKRKLAGFPESFAFVRLGRGQILPHSLLMTVGHYLCSLLEGILNEARHVISETQPLIIWYIGAHQRPSRHSAPDMRMKLLAPIYAPSSQTKTQQSFSEKSYPICNLLCPIGLFSAFTFIVVERLNQKVSDTILGNWIF